MAFVFDNAEIILRWWRIRSRSTRCSRSAKKCRTCNRFFTTMRVGCATTSSRVYSRTKHRGGGQQFLKQQPTVIEDEIAKGRATITCAMFYTSGTTGNAKGVVRVRQPDAAGRRVPKWRR